MHTIKTQCIKQVTFFPIRILEEFTGQLQRSRTYAQFSSPLCFIVAVASNTAVLFITPRYSRGALSVYAAAVTTRSADAMCEEEEEEEEEEEGKTAGDGDGEEGKE